MMQKHVLFHLFRHSDAMAHLITEQIMVMDDPRFQNECYDSMSVFYLSKVSVIEIGSDKMLIVMLVSIERVS